MVRVRFAPSPTGLPHVGNIRTALFNWLFARHNDGKFILRIEDTDRERYDPRALEAIVDGLRWLGLNWDEGFDIGGNFGPYFQSQRLEHYHEFARKLVADGKAYYCDCAPERLEQVREEMKAKKLNFMYDRRCRERHIQSDPTDPKTVIRFKMPPSGNTCFKDVLRGEVCFDNSTQDDIVLIKSDGFPTYNYAVVIDDHLMEITHIMRGDEFISSAGKHELIFDALGWETPQMLHLPIILGPDKSKLSKRHGATAIADFQAQGILPEAMFNFLALLGWSAKDDSEILSREEIVQRFDIAGFSTAPAVFDFEKLKWMNGEYIRKMTPHKLSERLAPLYRQWGWLEKDATYNDKVSAAMQERLVLLIDMKAKGEYFFNEPAEYDSKGVAKEFKPETADILRMLANEFQNLPEWDEHALENVIRDFCEKLNVGAGKIIHPVRLAVSGLTGGPGLFVILEILGKDTTSRRLQKAAEWIEKNVK